MERFETPSPTHRPWSLRVRISPTDALCHQFTGKRIHGLSSGRNNRTTPSSIQKHVFRLARELGKFSCLALERSLPDPHQSVISDLIPNELNPWHTTEPLPARPTINCLRFVVPVFLVVYDSPFDWV